LNIYIQKWYTQEERFLTVSANPLLKSSPTIDATPLAAIAGEEHLQFAKEPSLMQVETPASAAISRLFYRYPQIETILHPFETIGNA